MSRRLREGSVRFDHLTKEYVLGQPRLYLAAAFPFGSGLGRGERLRALDDVSFDVSPGEAFALVGANGAGKTTALKCLAGITQPTAGRVLVNGRVAALIELGVGFHMDLTGLENVRFAAAIAGLHGKEARRVVEDAIEFSEIERFIETPVKRYSSGMYARLSFGIAQAIPSEIMLVDEILAVGDVAFQRKCYARLNEFRQQGRTLVSVSHNEWVLKETCERAVLLSHGKVEAIGPIEDILKQYHLQVEPTPDRFMAGPDQLLRIRQVRIVPDDRRTVRLHETLTFQCDVTVSDDAHEPALGAAMFDGHGRLVWGIYSYENGISLDSGEHRVTVTLEDVNLLPGPCRFQVFAFDRVSAVIEDLRRLDLVIDGDAPHTFESGLVHVPSSWSLESASDTDVVRQETVG